MAKNTASEVDSSDYGFLDEAVKATAEVVFGHRWGTGFFLDRSGLFVTARHVVEYKGLGARKIRVRINPTGPEEREVVGHVFWSHRVLDCALAFVETSTEVPFLTLGDPASLHFGQSVWTIGCFEPYYNTVSRGVVSNPRARHSGIDYIQTDAGMDSGYSGGPLLSSDGTVVGMSVWMDEEVHAARFALPLDYIAAEVETALRDGPEISLAATYCRSCGHSHRGQVSWFCSNCGYQSKPTGERETEEGRDR
jgi:S1-C subfamily serine protease